MHGIAINRKKCVFGQDCVKYLGHMVSPAGISPMPERVQALQDFPPPSSKLALQRYLGMLNYYRRFVPHLASVLSPLHTLLAGKKKEFPWAQEHDAALAASKAALVAATLLHHPSPSAETALHVDASNTCLLYTSPSPRD